MSRLAAEIILGIVAAFSFYTAFISLRRPQAFGVLLGLGTIGASGTNEIRAQYGGFFLGVGIVGALALASIVPLAAAMLLSATVFGGLIFGRVFSVASGEAFSSYTATIKMLFMVDALGFIACLLGFLSLPLAG